jgi:hypothetical protein
MVILFFFLLPFFVYSLATHLLEKTVVTESSIFTTAGILLGWDMLHRQIQIA